MVDQLLGGLFGAKDDDDEPTRRGRARDYVDRYERGAYDQIGDDEVLQNYRAATSRLSPDEYQIGRRGRRAADGAGAASGAATELKRRSRDRYDARDDSLRKSPAPCSKRTRNRVAADWLGSLASAARKIPLANLRSIAGWRYRRDARQSGRQSGDGWCGRDGREETRRSRTASPGSHSAHRFELDATYR